MIHRRDNSPPQRRPGWVRACGLCVLGAAAGACESWPYFTYAPPEDVLVDEREVGEARAQYLGVLSYRTVVRGSIESTGTQPSDVLAEYGYDIWYTGDVDYFAFEVGEVARGTLALDWTSVDSDLDVYLFTLDPATGELIDLLNASAEPGLEEERLAVEGLDPASTYLILLGGRDGPGSAYTLTIDIETETSPR